MARLPQAHNSLVGDSLVLSGGNPHELGWLDRKHGDGPRASVKAQPPPKVEDPAQRFGIGWPLQPFKRAAVILMGDKSPKAKDKNRKQNAGAKSQKKADAANKAMATGTKKVK